MATTEKVFKFIKGDTWKGTANLRVIDACNDSKFNTYAIPTGATFQMIFPGSVSILSSAAEITVVNAAKGQISWVVSAAKSANATAGDKLAVDLIVTELDGSITTFEKLKIVNIKARENS